MNLFHVYFTTDAFFVFLMGGSYQSAASRLSDVVKCEFISLILNLIAIALVHGRP